MEKKKQKKGEGGKKSWEMSSSLSRVQVEVSVSQALFPPLHWSASFMNVSSLSLSAPSGISERKIANFKKEKKKQNILQLCRYGDILNLRST